MSEWISVEDEFPSKNRAVLVTIVWPRYPDKVLTTGVDMAEYCPGDGWISYSREDEYRSEECLYSRIGAKVTHWMPLPDPPTEVTQ